MAGIAAGPSGMRSPNWRMDGYMEAKGTLALRRLVGRLYKQYVSAADQALFDFVFSNEPTQESLKRCLDACDIEVVGADKAVLLSYVGYEHPELKFSDYAGPRIKGLNTFFRFKNMKVLSHFSRIGKAYNEAGIPMLLFKGGAMKVLRPNLSRPMGDVDILIPAERIDEATAIGESLGYMHFWEESKHAVDFHTETETLWMCTMPCSTPRRDVTRHPCAKRFSHGPHRTTLLVWTFCCPAMKTCVFW